MSGRVVEIYRAEKAGGPLVGVEVVRAVPGLGLEGDRYFLGKGSMSRWPGAGRAVSLIEDEVIDAVGLEWGLDLSAGRSRRNIVTAGVALGELIGVRFRIGAAVFRGVRPCDPCGYLERRGGAGLGGGVRGRGGLGADVGGEGLVRGGDGGEVVPVGV